MILDHIGGSVSDLPKSKAFYEAALAPLGIKLMMEFDGACGFGKDAPQFWIDGGDGTKLPSHVAFRAANRAEVDAFYDAALKAGGKDNGAPGLREIYHPHYYGAFILDPDGNNIEAVCHESP